tara:strand:- start:21 stop:596 length:576 start_codon:yes stop_codon:yes gene_type:complete
MGYEHYKLVDNYGGVHVYDQLTHVTIAAMLFLMVVHVVVSGTKKALEFIYTVSEESILNYIPAVVSTIGTSLAYFLYIASTLLIAGVNGSLSDDFIRDSSEKRTIIAFVLNHFIPIFAWIPLYLGGYEVQLLNHNVHAFLYLISVPIICVLYVAILALMSTEAPAVEMVDVVPSSFAAVFGLIAWGVGAFV